jgi:hypothetical protein
MRVMLIMRINQAERGSITNRIVPMFAPPSRVTEDAWPSRAATAGTEVTAAFRITAKSAATDFRVTGRNGMRMAARQTQQLVRKIACNAFMGLRQRMHKNNFFEPNVANEGFFIRETRKAVS